MRVEDGFHVIVLADGSEIPCRTVIIASGARYQRLAVDELERFEGAGRVLRGHRSRSADLQRLSPSSSSVAATPPARPRSTSPQQGSQVSIVIREQRPDAQHVAVPHRADRRRPAHRGVDRHRGTRARRRRPSRPRHARAHAHGRARTVECSGLFCFIGADPATAWLGDALELDAKGFILTDRSLAGSDHARSAVRDARPAAVRDVGRRACSRSATCAAAR